MDDERILLAHGNGNDGRYMHELISGIFARHLGNPVLDTDADAVHLPGLKFMRDPTCGGIATVAHEISHATGFALMLQQARLPVRDKVQSVCELS